MELTLDGNFLPLLESTLRLFESFNLLQQDVGAKEEIKQQRIRVTVANTEL